MTTASATQPYSVVVPGAHLMGALVGPHDAHLRLIERSFPNATVVARGNEIHVVGEQAAVVGRLCEELVTLLQRGQQLDESSVKRAIDMVRENESPARVLSDDILRGAKGKPIRPKTAGADRPAAIHVPSSVPEGSRPGQGTRSTRIRSVFKPNAETDRFISALDIQTTRAALRSKPSKDDEAKIRDLMARIG